MTAPHRGGPPQKEVGGPDVATGTAAHPVHKSSSRNRRQDGYAPPDADERFEQWVLDEAERLGYRLTCRCLDCKRWLADPVSIAHQRGPTCRQRAGVGT